MLSLYQETINTVRRNYQLVCDPIDLSVFYTPNGRQKIFNILKNCHKSRFEDNERIVVLQPIKDYYSYPEVLASDCLVFLQQSLQQIDISNFFVTVITGNREIQQELQWLQQNHSTDHHAIGYVMTEDAFSKQESRQDTFCVLPWLHLYATTNLEMAPCCVADQSDVWGSLVLSTPLELINSESARQMRLRMLSGKKSTQCAKCYVYEQSGFASRRQRENEKYQQLIPSLRASTDQHGAIDSYQPLTLDVRLNNTCNLQCRTCDGKSSSKLAQEEAKLFGNVKNLGRLRTTKIRQQALEQLLGFIDGSRHIYFGGGEPLIMSEHYQTLDRLLSQNKTDIELVYSTNFTSLYYQDLCVLDYWQKFQNVTVGASIDGHHEIFEYVRHGAVWSDIEKNLDLLQTRCPHIKFQVTSTISIYSAESVMELQRSWHENQILDIENFYIIPVSPEEYFSLPTLKSHHKKYLSKKIDAHCEWLHCQKATRLTQSWQEISHMMWADDQSYKNNLIAHVNQARDRARHENFEKLYPQYRDLFLDTDEHSVV
jgi:hypothetical protein